MDAIIFISYFTYEEMEGLSNVSKVIELAIGLAGNWTQAAQVRIQALSHYTFQRKKLLTDYIAVGMGRLEENIREKYI